MIATVSHPEVPGRRHRQPIRLIKLPAAVAYLACTANHTSRAAVQCKRHHAMVVLVGTEDFGLAVGAEADGDAEEVVPKRAQPIAGVSCKHAHGLPDLGHHLHTATVVGDGEPRAMVNGCDGRRDHRDAEREIEPANRWTVIKK